MSDEQLNLDEDWGSIVEWVNRQPDTDDGVLLRALVAEVSRLREIVNPPRVMICNNAESHERPCGCGNRNYRKGTR